MIQVSYVTILLCLSSTSYLRTLVFFQVKQMDGMDQKESLDITKNEFGTDSEIMRELWGMHISNYEGTRIRSMK